MAIDYPHRMAGAIRQRANRLMAWGGKRRGNTGYCPICESRVFFNIEGDWLRDEYRCNKCRSIPRWRALILVLNELFPQWREAHLHESSPGGPASEKLARECKNYIGTHYFPGASLGSVVQGWRCEDLAHQTFADQMLDLVVTSDVLEHLLHPRASIEEIARTLKPGGAHVFTVPWYHWKSTVARAREEDGRIVYLEKPDYHGNPIGDGASLVVTEWGRELPFLLTEWSGLSTSVFRTVDRTLGIDGEFLEVFVCRKSADPGARI